MIKCAFLGVILAARRFKWHISLVIRCKTHVCHVPSVVNDLWSQNYRAPLKTRQHTMLLSNEGVRKAIASFYRDDSATVFLGLLTIFVPKIYLPTFSVKCVRFSPCRDRDFRKRPGYFQIFPTNFRTLPNVPKIKCPQMLPKTFEPPVAGWGRIFTTGLTIMGSHFQLNC